MNHIVVTLSTVIHIIPQAENNMTLFNPIHSGLLQHCGELIYTIRIGNYLINDDTVNTKTLQL